MLKAVVEIDFVNAVVPERKLQDVKQAFTYITLHIDGMRANGVGMNWRVRLSGRLMG